MVFQGPAATIRWIGNERVVAPYPCWATVPNTSDYNGPGDPDGSRWLPGECDVPVRNHEWFWAPDDEHKLYSLDDLLDMYYQSVGHNCNLLLNANPGPDGLVPAADFQRYVEFGRELDRCFVTPLAETQGTGALLELALDRPEIVDHVSITEEIATANASVNTGWKAWSVPTAGMLCDGVSIGHKRIQRFDSVEVAAIRPRITQSVAEPQIRSLALYRVD